MRTIHDLNPDLSGWIIIEGYGKVLSRKRPRQSPFPLKVRELIAVDGLTALGWDRQLRMHIEGALNVGATCRELEEVIFQTCIFAGYPRAIEGLQMLDQISK
jgi:4-carboxymuconolactone decarboxylase